MSKYTQFEINPKSVYTSHDEGFDKNSVSFHRKKLLPLAGISEKTEENGVRILFLLKNWFKLNFMNGVHQQKKALNKYRRFAINQKPFPIAGMKD